MKIASLVLLLLGCLMLTVTLMYGKKHAIRSVRKEYKLITSGARMNTAESAQGKSYDARKAAQGVYQSLDDSSKAPRKEVKLTSKEQVTLAKAEARIRLTREEHQTRLLQADQRPDAQVNILEEDENTELLLEENTILLEEIDPGNLEEITAILEDDEKTELLLEKKEERE